MEFQNSKILSLFDRLSPIVSDEIGGPVHLVRITGPRWSYVAGYVPDELPYVAPKRVMLNEEWGILFYPEAGRKIDLEKVREFFLKGLEADGEA